MNHDPRPSASIVKILVRPPLCNPFRSFLSILLIPRLASALPGKHSGQWEGATPHFKLQLEGMYRLSFTSYLSCRIAIFPIAWQFQPLGAAGEIHLRVSRDFSLGKHDFDGYPSAKSPRSTSGLQLFDSTRPYTKPLGKYSRHGRRKSVRNAAVIGRRSRYWQAPVEDSRNIPGKKK